MTLYAHFCSVFSYYNSHYHVFQLLFYKLKLLQFLLLYLKMVNVYAFLSTYIFKGVAKCKVI